jgi:xylan 1,4-beta-xylosidase
MPGAHLAIPAANDLMPAIEFRCDLAQRGTPLPHCWEHTIGSCHAPLALRADWQEQLRRCHAELGFRYVRFHGLLSDDVGTVVRQQHRLLYSFFNSDRIIDFLLSIDVRPFVELSFMPEALASGGKTVFHYRGNVTPLRDYRQWAELIDRLVRHWVDRYGVTEVRKWFFEVWNEPNLKAFWTGTRRDYFRLYRETVRAIKNIDAGLPVGGPATAHDEWIEEFVEFCDRQRLPADFISTHHYPTDALVDPGTDTDTQLAHSRRSIMRQWAQDTKRRAAGRPVYYTEWNASSNPRDPLHDRPYTAAFIVKTALEASGIADGYGFWTFTDLFEENYFPSMPFHGGFGLLTIHGIAKPAYRAFELLHALGDERLMVDGIHPTVDAWVTRGRRGVTVVMTNHALPQQPIQRERARIFLRGSRRPRSASMRRIDERHANARRTWLALGSPEYLSSPMLARLDAASGLRDEPCSWSHEDGTTSFQVQLEPHSVTAVTLPNR